MASAQSNTHNTIAPHTTLHFRGEIGLWLKTRAIPSSQLPHLFIGPPPVSRSHVLLHTFLKYRRLVNLCHPSDVLMLLVHDCRVEAPAASLSQLCIFVPLLLLQTWPFLESSRRRPRLPVRGERMNAGGRVGAGLGSEGLGNRWSELATLWFLVPRCRDS